MGVFEQNSDSYFIDRETSVLMINNESWHKFDTSILGLDDIAQESTTRSIICTIFDLEGFTTFCGQNDPQLFVPSFLQEYLDWFFNIIKTETERTETEKTEDGISIWHKLPFLIKFMGDGLLLLWDIAGLNINSQANIIVSCNIICEEYSEIFLPNIRRKIPKVPEKLRCGIAKGNVFSIGNGTDYVGPCINIASKLQKLPGLTFAFSGKGFFIEKVGNDYISENFIEKITEVHGIGKGEIIYIKKKEYENMDEKYKELYSDP